MKYGFMFFTLFGAISWGAEPTYQQDILLHPGWNAVFLEVDTGETDLTTLFEGLQIASVWSFDPSFSSREFVKEQSEALVNKPEWHVFFPLDRDEAVLNNLYALQANFAYLIKLEGSQNVTWTVTGPPRLRYPKWVPNAYNLTGFPVDPVSPATFTEFLSQSQAHSGQPIFRLNTSGVWEQVSDPGSTLMRSGEAYWIYSDGASTFRAPLDLTVSDPDGLYFEYGVNRLSMTINNRASSSGGISLFHLPQGDTLPMKYWQVDSLENNSSWVDLPSTFETTSDEPLILWLATSRKDFQKDEMAGILEISDGAGTRWLVPTHGYKQFPITSSTKSASSPYQGLWVGTVTIDQVSEAFSNQPEEPQPTIQNFSYRIMFHVDQSGITKLLKEVTLMFQEGQNGEDGRYVLLTDPALIPDYHGATLIDGEPVGYRISCLAYDFDGMEHDTVGDFGWLDDGSGPYPGTPLTCELVLGVDAVTNPFKHKYHPDHDNKTADFENFKAEAYEIIRIMSFEFSMDAPNGENSPEWGSSEMGGVFSESVSGLFSKEQSGGEIIDRIRAKGTFKLKRISSEGVINE